MAAWQLSEHLGWGLVPPTVLRETAPSARARSSSSSPPTSRPTTSPSTRAGPDLHDQLRPICAFDLLVNNTDRKSGHCLLGLDGRVWAIDNGLCFAQDDKLRTVIWEFGDERMPAKLLVDVRRIADCIPLEVATLLDDDEVVALQRRAQQLVAKKVFPIDRSGRRYPWPLV